MGAKDHLYVAVDVSSYDEGKAIVMQLAPYVRGFKFGLQFFTANGPRFVREELISGDQAFLDLKLHDIPNTVAGAITFAAEHRVRIINVHCLGGSKMLRNAAEAAQDAEKKFHHRPLVLGVTILTSHSYADLVELGLVPRTDNLSGDIRERFEKDIVSALVLKFAQMAKDCGLDGVIASPKETKFLRDHLGDRFIIGNPGIRPAGTALNDQVRVGTPANAIRDGDSFIVVGRPITKPETGTPVEAAKAIVAEIESALADKE